MHFYKTVITNVMRRLNILLAAFLFSHDTLYDDVVSDFDKQSLRTHILKNLLIIED